MDYLRISERREGAVGVLAVAGELDYFSGPLIEESVARLAAAGICHIVLDLAQLDFCDGHGMRMLIASHEKLLAQEGWLHLARADWKVREVRMVIVSGHLLELFESVTAAITGVSMPRQSRATCPAGADTHRRAYPLRDGAWEPLPGRGVWVMLACEAEMLVRPPILRVIFARRLGVWRGDRGHSSCATTPAWSGPGCCRGRNTWALILCVGRDGRSLRSPGILGATARRSLPTSMVSANRRCGPRAVRRRRRPLPHNAVPALIRAFGAAAALRM